MLLQQLHESDGEPDGESNREPNRESNRQPNRESNGEPDDICPRCIYHYYAGAYDGCADDSGELL